MTRRIKKMSFVSSLRNYLRINRWIELICTIFIAVATVRGCFVQQDMADISKRLANIEEISAKRDNTKLQMDYAQTYDRQLTSGANLEISIALEKGRSILKEHGGKFATSDLDIYLGLYNQLDECFDLGQISGEIVYNNFSDDLIRAYRNNEIRAYLKKRREEDADNFKGFDDLAEYCLKENNERVLK